MGDAFSVPFILSWCSCYVVTWPHHVTFTICTRCRSFDIYFPNNTINKPRPGENRRENCVRKVFATAVWHPLYRLFIKGFVKDVNVAYQTNKLSSFGILFCQILCQANNKFTSSCQTKSDSKTFGSIAYFLGDYPFLSLSACLSSLKQSPFIFQLTIEILPQWFQSNISIIQVYREI